MWLSCRLHQFASAFKRGSHYSLEGSPPISEKGKYKYTCTSLSTSQAPSAWHKTLLMDSLNSRSASWTGSQGAITIWQLHLPDPASFYFGTIPILAQHLLPRDLNLWQLHFLNHCSMITPFLRWYVMKYLRVKNHNLCNFLSKRFTKIDGSRYIQTNKVGEKQV